MITPPNSLWNLIPLFAKLLSMLIGGNNKLFIGSNRFSAPRITLALILFAILTAGCASRHIVPVQDSGVINPELKSISKTVNGVTVTVITSAWKNTPRDLGSYVTPFFVAIQNDTPRALSLGYENVLILDDNRKQYNPIPAETVAQILQNSYRRRYAFRPYFSFGFGYSSFRYHRFNSFFFNDIFYDPFYDPWYYRPAYYSDYSEGFDEVFNQALFPGSIQSNAKIEGFIYFKKIPTEVKRITLKVSYRVQGEPEAHKLTFPFSIEERRR